MKLVRLNGSKSIVMAMDKTEIDGVEIIPNSCDAAFEKHVPQYEFTDDGVLISVNHVMEEDHYIEWILVEYYNEQVIEYFQPGEDAKVLVAYEEGMRVYAYCNKHGLWLNDNIVNEKKDN